MSIKKEILDNIKSLPAMNTTTKKIMAILGSTNVEISEVVKIIEYDPALTSNVLKLVNSAYFGLQSEVTSIKQAVVLLGLNQIYRIVIAVSFSSLMNKPIAGYELPSGALWKHCVATAIASETIAQMLKNSDADVLFTAALLHDIGKIALSTFVDEYYNLIEEESRKIGESFEIIERKVLGIDHAEAGAIILKNWGIPEGLYSPVRWHHSPDDCTPAVTVDIVHVADSLCLTGGLGIGREGLQYRPSIKVMKRLSLKTETMEMIMSRTMTGLDNIKEIFEI